MSTPTAPQRHRIVSHALIIAGALVLLASPLAGLLAGTAAGAASVLTSAGEQRAFTHQATVEADATERFYLHATDPDAHDAADCHVADARTTLPLMPAVRAQNTTVGLTRYDSFATFVVPAAGTVTISCGTANPLVVAPSFDTRSFLATMGLWGLLPGGALAIGGFALLVIGIVRLTRAEAGPAQTPSSPPARGTIPAGPAT